MFHSTIDATPRCARGVQKFGQLNWSPLCWRAKIQPKLKNLWKTIKIEQKLSKNCFLKVFPISFNLSQILVLQFAKAVFSLFFQIFWHPWHPWSHWFKILFWYFCTTTAPSGDFSYSFKLKSDITCIDITSIKSDNITF